MHFASRTQAGRQLAARLKSRYRFENCAVVALDDGGAIIGAQIAIELHCVLTMLVDSPIALNDEPEPIAGVTPGGGFAFNKEFQQEQLGKFIHEYYGFGYFETQKLNRSFELGYLVGDGAVIKPELLRGHNVIVVSEGFQNGFPIDLAAAYLKPIAIEKFVVAAPLASLEAVDHMHALADELQCLSVVENYTDTERYYDQHDVPDHATVLKTIEDIVLHWR